MISYTVELTVYLLNYSIKCNYICCISSMIRRDNDTQQGMCTMLHCDWIVVIHIRCRYCPMHQSLQPSIMLDCDKYNRGIMWYTVELTAYSLNAALVVIVIVVILDVLSGLYRWDTLYTVITAWFISGVILCWIILIIVILGVILWSILGCICWYTAEWGD